MTLFTQVGGGNLSLIRCFVGDSLSIPFDHVREGENTMTASYVLYHVSTGECKAVLTGGLPPMPTEEPIPDPILKPTPEPTQMISSNEASEVGSDSSNSDAKQDESNGPVGGSFPVMAIVGIVIGVVVVAAIVGAVMFRVKSKDKNDLEFLDGAEDVMIYKENVSVDHDNELKDMDDDPYEHDFDSSDASV